MKTNPISWLLGALALLAALSASAAPSDNGIPLKQVQDQLKIELKNPRNAVAKWLRMINETASMQDGRWGGVSKDYQVVPVGRYLETRPDFVSYQYLLVFVEHDGFHGGSQDSPLVFKFSVKQSPKLELFDYALVALANQGLLGRMPGSYDILPTDDVSAETRSELAREILLAAGPDEVIPDFENGNGAAVKVVVEDIVDNAAKANADTSVSCLDKAGQQGIATCTWGFVKGPRSEHLTFDFYKDNYVNGQHVGKWGKLLPGTIKFTRK